jgi:glutamyl-Q tRNA(Asp) synthetase
MPESPPEEKFIACCTNGSGRRTSHVARTIGRFAPSPTGPLHLGSLVAAVGSYVMAKRAGGHWLMRMDDLDAPRVVPGMADDILRTLETLGLHWDGKIVWQSRRLEAYRAALELLEASGSLYPCGCSRAEIARISSAPHAGDDGPIYPGLCRDGLQDGKLPRALRVRVDDTVIIFNDQVMGEVRQNLLDECGDFVVKRADGPYSYHLAVVVDDADYGINQVVRGVDLLPSTPRQIYLQRLLGLPMPTYCHLPLVTGPNGEKLSKRDNAVSLASGRNLMLDGGRLLTAALRFLGQDPPVSATNAPASEILSWAVAHFDPLRIPCRPDRFPES